MAMPCRSAVMATGRSMCTRSNTILKTLAPKPIPTSHFSSSVRNFPTATSRILSAVGSLESKLPLHSVIASARLKSNIAFDSSCWSLLSQDFAIPR
ncbi:Hypothetical predicted protein [Olea europaea subsp. europaea]|uniref:Uncharacterized protein n=1 Tax=Olea europaea subsp. europaea TaxID=158383 RepID=A0A8S0T2D7_OLEEU|nr:Hypothetical predicted protein [Olea europaea subsp. europaea]